MRQSVEGVDQKIGVVVSQIACQHRNSLGPYLGKVLLAGVAQVRLLGGQH